MIVIQFIIIAQKFDAQENKMIYTECQKDINQDINEAYELTKKSKSIEEFKKKLDYFLQLYRNTYHYKEIVDQFSKDSAYFNIKEDELRKELNLIKDEINQYNKKNHKDNNLLKLPDADTYNIEEFFDRIQSKVMYMIYIDENSIDFLSQFFYVYFRDKENTYQILLKSKVSDIFEEYLEAKEDVEEKERVSLWKHLKVIDPYLSNEKYISITDFTSLSHVTSSLSIIYNHFIRHSTQVQYFADS